MREPSILTNNKLPMTIFHYLSPLSSNRRRFTTLLLLVMFTGSLTSCADQTESTATDPEDPARPNIIYILADDLGYGDIGAFGGEEIQTPNLDRMAEEGMKFTHHYSGSTVCAPARSVLMTGLHGGHTPIRGNREILPIGQHPLPEGTLSASPP